MPSWVTRCPSGHMGPRTTDAPPLWMCGSSSPLAMLCSAAGPSGLPSQGSHSDTCHTCHSLGARSISARYPSRVSTPYPASSLMARITSPRLCATAQHMRAAASDGGATTWPGTNATARGLSALGPNTAAPGLLAPSVWPPRRGGNAATASPVLSPVGCGTTVLPWVACMRACHLRVTQRRAVSWSHAWKICLRLTSLHPSGEASSGASSCVQPTHGGRGGTCAPPSLSRPR